MIVLKLETSDMCLRIANFNDSESRSLPQALGLRISEAVAIGMEPYQGESRWYDASEGSIVIVRKNGFVGPIRKEEVANSSNVLPIMEGKWPIYRLHWLQSGVTPIKSYLSTSIIETCLSNAIKCFMTAHACEIASPVDNTRFNRGSWFVGGKRPALVGGLQDSI